MCALKHRPSHVVMTLWKMCRNTQTYIHACAQIDYILRHLCSRLHPVKVNGKTERPWCLPFTLQTQLVIGCGDLGPVVHLHLERSRSRTVGVVRVCLSINVDVCLRVLILWPSDLLPISRLLLAPMCTVSLQIEFIILSVQYKTV